MEGDFGSELHFKFPKAHRMTTEEIQGLISTASMGGQQFTPSPSIKYLATASEDVPGNVSWYDRKGKLKTHNAEEVVAYLESLLAPEEEAVPLGEDPNTHPPPQPPHPSIYPKI